MGLRGEGELGLDKPGALHRTTRSWPAPTSTKPVPQFEARSADPPTPTPLPALAPRSTAAT